MQHEHHTHHRPGGEPGHDRAGRPRHHHGPRGRRGFPGDVGPGGFGPGAAAFGEVAAAFAQARRGGPRGFGPDGPEFPGGPGDGRRGGRGHGGRGPGGPGGRGGRGGWRGAGGWQQADLPSADDAADWLTGRLPDGWFVGAPRVEIDREEITVVGELPAVENTPAAPADGDGDTPTTSGSDAAAAGRITRFREQTRDERMAIDAEAQARYGRSIAWGARIGDVEQLFTNASVPVMTRLRQPERRVLDTLVDSGVARSRSDALVWCVRLVGEHADEWLGSLREAMTEVDRLRTEGPTV